VAKAAIDAVWYQKWVIHCGIARKAGGGLVYLQNKGAVTAGTIDCRSVHFKALACSQQT